MLEFLGGWLQGFFGRVESDSFPLLFGATYLVAKIALKQITRKQAGERCDSLDVLAWFGVDLSVLSVVFSAVARLTQVSKFSNQGGVIWYFLLVFCVFASCSLYGLFLRKRRHSSGWSGRVQLGLLVATGVVVGFAPFLGVLALLVKGVANA